MARPQRETLRVLATAARMEGERPAACWATWLGQSPVPSLPPLRAILVWDHLADHRRWSIVHSLFQHGVMPLSTPLSGSWLNMAESLQRIRCGTRGHSALAGQPPTSEEQLMIWLDEAVAGWNADRPGFAWGGKRQERRQRPQPAAWRLQHGRSRTSITCGVTQ